MPTEKWSAATDRNTIVSTELNALADAAYSAASPVLDNSANLDRYGIAELVGSFGTNPNDRSVLELYAVIAQDGSNYADGGGAVRPSDFLYLGSFQVRAVTTTQRVATQPFLLPPFKVKFVVFNRTGQALGATGNTVTLKTFNRVVN